MATTKKIKVILTKAGTAYDATKEYKLHDYIVIDNATMYVCKRVDATTMVCKGHDITDTTYWDKSVDLSEAQSKAKTLSPEEYEKSGIFFENTFVFDDLTATTNYANYQKNDDNIEFTLIGSGYGGVQYAELKVKCENADVSTGDVVFVRLKAKISTIENISTTKFIYPMQKSRKTVMEDISAADTYTTLYGIYSFADGVFEKQIWLRPAFSSRDAATDVKVTVKDIEVYNLTKVYGAGNEPTSAADFNALIGDEFHPYRVNIIDAKQINDDVTSLNDEVKKVGNFGKIKNYFGSTADITPAATSYNKSFKTNDGIVRYLTMELSCDSEITNLNVKTSGGNYNITDLVVDEWRQVTAYSVKGFINLGFTFADANKHTIKLRNCMLLQLTDIYGSGNEPNQTLFEQMLANVPSENFGAEYPNILTEQFFIGSERKLQGIADETYVHTDPDGNVQISSATNQYWSGWTEIGSYGLIEKGYGLGRIPIYNKVHGAIETDALVSVVPLWSQWSKNATPTTGSQYEGGHVFHGWTTDRKHRLTMLQNIYRSDEAAIFNYIPGDKSSTGEGIFLRLRLGADNICKGMLIDPIYSDTAYQYARVTVFGILNIQHGTCSWDVNGKGATSTLPVSTIPASSTAEGVQGDFTFDENYAYFCTATNVWKRVKLEEW